MNANRNTTARLISAAASLAVTWTLLSSVLGVAAHEQTNAAGALLAQAAVAAQRA